MATLRRIRLKGFKSIKEMDLELRPLNVLIGANGAGKSNLVSYFKMLNEMMNGRLQQYIAGAGRAQSILYYGPKHTPQMEARLEFETDEALNIYTQKLFHVAGDTLAFSDEQVDMIDLREENRHLTETSLGTGHLETKLKIDPKHLHFGTIHVQLIEKIVSDYRVYHFHDTSPTARMRNYCYVGDNRRLMSDGGNLAAYLFRLRDEKPAIYRRIVSTIQLVAPFVDDFDLVPTPNRDIILNWRSQSDNGETVFGPHQFSDGTLRAMCLITLLLQPEDELPSLIVIDEPELGLHPYALNVIASLFKKVSLHTQVILGTQSSTLLDQFDPEDVVVVNRVGTESQFLRLDADRLETWLEDYSLGEVWEKNVLGGGPH